MRTINIAALNVVMPVPHNAERYVRLFIAAYRRKIVVKLRGEFAAMIGSCRAEELDGQTVVRGEFYKFFDLNINSQWFNLLEQRQAEDEDLAEIRIPEHLKPHFQIFPFVFFPHRHRLIFITTDQVENFSPGQAQKLLKYVFDHFMLVREYGEIEVTVEPSTESLQLIFGMPKLKRLNIEVIPPNPDDLEEAERKLLEKMRHLHAGKMRTELVTNSPRGLTPDAEIKTLAEIAKSNGRVDGHGEDEQGRVVDVSTVEHPLIERIEFDPVLQQRSEALIEAARSVLRRIRLRG